MPQASADEIGRPVPKLLEIEVVKKFMKFDSQYAEDKKREFPHLLKPAPELGASGTGGVEWVGLNVDPCKAKYLAKCGIVRSTAPTAAVPMKAKKTGFSLDEAMSTAPLPYPHWRSEHPISNTRPPTSRTVLSSSSSMPASLPGIAIEDAKSQFTKRSSKHSSVVTKASVAKAVSKEVQRQLNEMSCNEHFLEQKLLPKWAPSCVDPAPNGGVVTPVNLTELLYYGVSADLQGRHSYLHKRHRIMPQDRHNTYQTSAGEVGWLSFAGTGKPSVGKMMIPFKPPPDTISIS